MKILIKILVRLLTSSHDDVTEKALKKLPKRELKEFYRRIRQFALFMFVLFFAMTAEGTTENYFSSSGTVKFYNEEQGFGYIVDSVTKDEIFFYEDGLIDEISGKNNVIYKIRNTRKGFEAYDVKLKQL